MSRSMIQPNKSSVSYEEELFKKLENSIREQEYDVDLVAEIARVFTKVNTISTYESESGESFFLAKLVSGDQLKSFSGRLDEIDKILDGEF